MTYHLGIKRIVYAWPPRCELRIGLIDSASGRGIGPGRSYSRRLPPATELAFAMPTKDSSMQDTHREQYRYNQLHAPTGYPSRQLRRHQRSVDGECGWAGRCGLPRQAADAA